MTDTKEKAEAVVSKRRTAYLTSIDSNGFPVTRAMLAPRKREGLKVFYMTTNTSSSKVSHFQKNSKACLYFCEPSKFKGVEFIGNVDVLQDPASKEMIWQEGDTMYYPKGVTDPDYAVIRFTAVSGRMYENFSVSEFSAE